MKSGTLRHYVTIQTRTYAGPDRQPLAGWTDSVTSVPSCVEPLVGRKLELARQLVSNVDTKITLRYITGLDTTCRIIYNGRTFNVGSVTNLQERNLVMEVLAIEVKEA